MRFEKGNTYGFKAGKKHPKFIDDEYSNMNISRQMKHYLRKKRNENKVSQEPKKES